MLNEEARSLLVSQLRAGRSIPEMVFNIKAVCGNNTIYSMAKEFAAGVEEKPKKTQKHPWKKIDPKMAAIIIRKLTIGATAHTINELAETFKISSTAIR
ncbi:hypothetical protein BV898_02839 [Hypsibius exemplaris]|uniref:Uncharacterized protein n=1 Tax=Hypsibius exemplaris TaxID=2072580 RepID=A0A1W0X7B3_HYPEX|nr:hypothetical protein BV898_02839 [Hypsibius exemplaris]